MTINSVIQPATPVAPSAFSRLIDAARGILDAVADGLAASRRAAALEPLLRLSDAELVARGLSRDGLYARIFGH